mmetsp:Transcript_66263/g.149598  ORF Transcript_66263/g.149598 Transcript_66263/m.149598 type:complete len:276 (+) Transcript_66263:642-1469(+)
MGPTTPGRETTRSWRAPQTCWATRRTKARGCRRTWSRSATTPSPRATTASSGPRRRATRTGTGRTTSSTKAAGPPTQPRRAAGTGACASRFRACWAPFGTATSSPRTGSKTSSQNPATERTRTSTRTGLSPSTGGATWAALISASWRRGGRASTRPESRWSATSSSRGSTPPAQTRSSSSSSSSSSPVEEQAFEVRGKCVVLCGGPFTDELRMLKAVDPGNPNGNPNGKEAQVPSAVRGASGASSRASISETCQLTFCYLLLLFLMKMCMWNWRK